MDVVIKRPKAVRFEVWLADLDPTIGSELSKTRPVLIISPDEQNMAIRTVIIAPFTSTRKRYPTRVNVDFKDVAGQIALDQIRTIDKLRLVKKLGDIAEETASAVKKTLINMFS
jgi:mRNA interferase MazF